MVSYEPLGPIQYGHFPLCLFDPQFRYSNKDTLFLQFKIIVSILLRRISINIHSKENQNDRVLLKRHSLCSLRTIVL